jgi:putative FmdB family regulatory protein
VGQAISSPAEQMRYPVPEAALPIFEYLCGDCGKLFETLVLKPGRDHVSCPACGKPNVEQQLSQFLSPVPGKFKPKPRQHSEYPNGLITKHDD